MSPTTQGLLVLAATLIMLLSGAPVAFGLGAISVIFIVVTATLLALANSFLGLGKVLNVEQAR